MICEELKALLDESKLFSQKLEWETANNFPNTYNGKYLKDIEIVEKRRVSFSNYKVIEYTKIKSGKDKGCVLIGFNPTEYDVKEIDSTNQKIINYLKYEYNSFTLINLHILMTKNEQEFFDDEKDQRYHDKLLIEFLNKIKESVIDVIAFLGSEMYNDKEYVERVKKIGVKNICFNMKEVEKFLFN